MKNIANTILHSIQGRIHLWGDHRLHFLHNPPNFLLQNPSPNHAIGAEHGPIFPPICHQLLLSQSTTFGTNTLIHLAQVLSHTWHKYSVIHFLPRDRANLTIPTSPYLSQIAFVTIHLIWDKYFNSIGILHWFNIWHTVFNIQTSSFRLRLEIPFGSGHHGPNHIIAVLHRSDS